jgi:hypothetical protein
MALFAPKKEGNAHKRFPDAYYKQVYFDKAMFDGIELVGKIEKLSKKKAARLIMERGFSSYMGEKVGEAIKRELAARQLNEEPELTRFVLELRRFAKERGMDISKFI